MCSIVHSTDRKIFNCQFCDLTFRLHNELIMHESTHQRTIDNINLKRCKICGIACYNDDDLLAHFKQFHEHFECDLCKKVFRTKSHLKLHIKIHINAREFKCSICPKTFNFFTQVKRHEQTHSTTYVWYCEICGVGFKSKPSLSHHMRACHNGTTLLNYEYQWAGSLCICFSLQVKSLSSVTAVIDVFR